MATTNTTLSAWSLILLNKINSETNLEETNLFFHATSKQQKSKNNNNNSKTEYKDKQNKTLKASTET